MLGIFGIFEGINIFLKLFIRMGLGIIFFFWVKYLKLFWVVFFVWFLFGVNFIFRIL